MNLELFKYYFLEPLSSYFPKIFFVLFRISVRTFWFKYKVNLKSIKLSKKCFLQDKWYKDVDVSRPR